MMAWYAGMPMQKKLEKLIESNPNLSSILDDQDFMQELKAYNPKLLEYLTNTPELIGQAIEFLTQPPKDSDSPERKYKYPLMAMEMIETETVSIVNSFFKPVVGAAQGTIYLDLFFDSLSKDQLLPLLSGYFLRVCSTLVNCRMKQLTEYVFSRPNVFKMLIKHCQNTSIVSVIGLFLNIESSKQDRPYQQRRQKKLQVVTLCLACIQLNRSNPDGLVLQNMCTLLIQIVDKYYLIADGKEMLDLLTTDMAMQLFFSISQDKNTLLSQPIINLLVALIIYYAFSSMNSEDKINPEFSRKNRQRLEAQPLITNIVQRLESVVQQVRNCQNFSLYTFKQLELLCHCISLNSTSIFVKIRKSNFFALLLDLMFRFPEANIIHCLIEKTMMHIFINEKSIFEEYREHLFCEVDIIGRTLPVVAKPEASKMSFHGHLMKIIKIYSSIKTVNEKIINHIKAYGELESQVAQTIIKPYEQKCLKELSSYQIDVAQAPTEYKVRQMTVLPQQPITNKLLDNIDEQAKFMKSHAVQQHADPLDVGSLQPHIIQNDNFFKLPIQEVFQQRQQQSQEPLTSTANSTHKSSETKGQPKLTLDSFDQFLSKKKLEAGEVLKSQRSASQQRRLTPNKGNKLASPSPRKKNSWTDNNSEGDSREQDTSLPAAKFFKKDDGPKQPLPHVPLAKKPITQSTIFQRSKLQNTDQDLTKSMGNLMLLKNIKVKLSSEKTSDMKKCRKVEDRDRALLSFLGIPVNK